MVCSNHKKWYWCNPILDFEIIIIFLEFLDFLNKTFNVVPRAFFWDVQNLSIYKFPKIFVAEYSWSSSYIPSTLHATKIRNHL